MASPEPPPPFTIRQATTPEDLSSIRALFTSYATWLDLDLTFQNFASELASLPGVYEHPTGALLLALSSTSETIGCVALRPLPSAPPNSGICEMKRLFLTEKSRGLGIGRALVEKVVEKARELGYKEVKLDTLPRMAGARKLYESVGFKECERYYETPLEGTVFLGLRL